MISNVILINYYAFYGHLDDYDNQDEITLFSRLKSKHSHF